MRRVLCSRLHALDLATEGIQLVMRWCPIPCEYVALCYESGDSIVLPASSKSPPSAFLIAAVRNLYSNAASSTNQRTDKSVANDLAHI